MRSDAGWFIDNQEAVFRRKEIHRRTVEGLNRLRSGSRTKPLWSV
jgi:hypothetical protein